jgi:hypothetical protein
MFDRANVVGRQSDRAGHRQARHGREYYEGFMN